MELKAGYKQTEVGVIPEDWNLKVFKDICWVNQGLQIAIEKRLKHPAPLSKIYITIQYLNDSKQIEYINDYTSQVCCTDNDVLMTRTGNTGIVVTGVSGVFHNNFFKINYDKKQITKDYLVYYLNQNKVKKIILVKAGTSTIPDLNHSDFYTIPISLPPTLIEQTSIANALSDADALIQSLTRLIAKKHQIKQGAMQTLLNPYENGRLKAGWVVKKLEEVADIEMGQSPSSKNYNKKGHGLPLVQGNADIKNRETIIRTYTSEITKICTKGDIIMSVRAPVGEIAVATFDACIGRGVCAIKFPNKFIYHYLINIESSWKKLSKGSTFDSINSVEVKALVLYLPVKEIEQARIATLLSDMDAEMAALEAKLAKYRHIKQGMMQNLLTGRIRLI
ncbi:MAG: hypothetical protein RI993_2148 [Pseudomonadota bacterium]|jgi:type I restriction enzyme S subunit